MTLYFWPYFLPLRTNIKKQSMGHFVALFLFHSETLENSNRSAFRTVEHLEPLHQHLSANI